MRNNVTIDVFNLYDVVNKTVDITDLNEIMMIWSPIKVLNKPFSGIVIVIDSATSTSNYKVDIGFSEDKTCETLDRQVCSLLFGPVGSAI